MQGQGSAIGSFPETFELDHGTSSSGPVIDQQLSWNNMLNPVESRIPDCMSPPHDAEFTFRNVADHDGRSLSGWCLGESSSSGNNGNQIIHDEAKMEHAWPSLLNGCAGSGSGVDERRCEPTNILSLESVNLNLNINEATDRPLFLQNFSSSIPQNRNLNEGYSADYGSRHVEAGACPHLSKPSGSETYSGVSGYPSGTSSESVGFLAEETDGRPGCSLDGRRLACKRKTLEGVPEQLSLGGSSSCFNLAENSALQPLPASYGVVNGSSVTNVTESSSQQPNPRLGVDISLGSNSHSALSTAGNAESSRRNFRMRISPSRPDSLPSNLLSTGNSSCTSHASHYQSTPRLLSFNHPLELRPTTTRTTTPSPSHAMHTPGLPRIVLPAPQYSASSARVGSSPSSSVIPGERTTSQAEPNLRSIPRNVTEHPMYVPSAETRNLLQDPSWSLANGNTRISRNVARSSRVGSSTGVHPPAAPIRVPHNPPAQNSRRLSEIVRRNLILSPGSEAGGQGRNLHSLHSGLHASSQEIVHLSSTGHPGHHQPYHSSLRMDRQGEGILGVPLSQGLAAASREGRSRLVSEIRNALDFMRRGGEGVRLEDVFLLDQSLFYGMTDLHDRHREMRLDVDNMSYEELLALEERIGDVNTGLSEETIMKGLKQRNYMCFTSEVVSEIEPCCICQEAYVNGDNLGRLDCGHDFHTGCIKQWLTHKNLCPICKTTALVT